MLRARPNLPLNSDPACIAFRSLSAFRYPGFAQRLGAGGAGELHSLGRPMKSSQAHSGPTPPLVYLWSAYKQYFCHFREPFTQKKLVVLKISARWAWYSYFIGFAASLPLLLLVFNQLHPVGSILAFTVIVAITQPLIAAVISLVVKSIPGLNQAKA